MQILGNELVPRHPVDRGHHPGVDCVHPCAFGRLRREAGDRFQHAAARTGVVIGQTRPSERRERQDRRRPQTGRVELAPFLTDTQAAVADLPKPAARFARRLASAALNATKVLDVSRVGEKWGLASGTGR